MNIDTACIHSGYEASNGEARTVPVYLSTTFHYDSCSQVADIFNDPTLGMIYSRFENPTCDAAERKIAALEGGAAAMLTSSGQAANLLAVLNLCSSGDHFVCSSAIYGGTVNLFAFTLKRFGIDCTFVSPRATKEQIAEAIQPNTKLVFGETVSNPSLAVLDIETFAAAAHEAGIPLVMDNTFPTPAMCRPIEHGCDIVTHSTTKYMDGHAMTGGGVIVDSGTFDWAASGKFACLTEPDESYHGVVYTRDYPAAPYIVKARMQLMRDFGCYPSATNGFILHQTLETLGLRMRQHCGNAQAVAEWLEGRPEIERVEFPGLASSPDHDLAQKYLPEGVCGVISIIVAGGRDKAEALLNHLNLASIEVHVADSQTCVLHPASTTHRQLTDEQLEACGVEPGLVRLSCGLEDARDIIADLEQAFAAIN